MLAPPLLARAGHPALRGQWLLLAAPELWAEPRAGRGRAVALLGGAAGVHPYLLAMVLPLCAARAGLWTLGVVPVLWLLGAQVRGAAATGFGVHWADLLTLLLPGTGEGSAWLGPGVLAGALLAWGAARVDRRLAVLS